MAIRMVTVFVMTRKFWDAFKQKHATTTKMQRTPTPVFMQLAVPNAVEKQTVQVSPFQMMTMPMEFATWMKSWDAPMRWHAITICKQPTTMAIAFCLLAAIRVREQLMGQVWSWTMMRTTTGFAMLMKC